ncbi:cache domain-containing protein [Halomonas alkaliantarctica]|uniref:Cache domain-containing protein n=1 Tax=Halomonas alkaliantarctica TaxID=232346 RepID=A0ABY8LKX0_9GAMM|nr:cache domain-containing protein [Halomonas alkaliantarctica]WGI25081.1 cache domain-containing protein [Halomonas alkaliantarctica]
MSSLSNNYSLSECAQQLDKTLKTTFGQVRQLVEETQALWKRVEAEGRQPASKDLALLRPAINQQLLASGTFSCGGGIVLEPCCLADREMYLEWWYLADAGKTLPLRPNFDHRRENYYDYTEMPWYCRPRHTGKSVVEGPYIDLYGTNMYVLTFTIPIFVQGRFIGVAGIDLSLHSVERRLVRSLMRLEREVVLISSDERIIASNTANWMVGDLASNLLSTIPLTGNRLALPESEAGWSLVILPGLRKVV